MTQAPTGGWKANAYVIFDYFSPTDFKFAGIDVALNKAVVGHRTATGWVIDATGVVTGNVRDGRDGRYYGIQVIVNGLVVRVFVDGSEKLSYQYLPRYIDGIAYGLNMGLVGVGSNNARGTFDDFVVQSLPPTTTFESTDDFATGAGSFTGEKTGTW